MNVKSFNISWDNHLKFKDEIDPFYYSKTGLREVISMGKTVSWKYELEDGTVHEGMSAPEPPNPFSPVPQDPPEDWREGDEDDDD